MIIHPALIQQQIVGSYEVFLLDPMRNEPCIKVAMVSNISEIDGV